LFASFDGTIDGSDFSIPFIIGFSLRFPDTGLSTALLADVEISRLPRERLPYMPGSLTPRDGTILTKTDRDSVAFCGK
jgi:hypothetical protein